MVDLPITSPLRRSLLMLNTTPVFALDMDSVYGAAFCDRSHDDFVCVSMERFHVGGAYCPVVGPGLLPKTNRLNLTLTAPKALL